MKTSENVLWRHLKGRREGQSILTLNRKLSEFDKGLFSEPPPHKTEHKHMASIIFKITNQKMRLQLDVANKGVQLSTKLQ